MSNIKQAQPAGRQKSPTPYWGTVSAGMPETRPDGKIIRVSMLDPSDPGIETPRVEHVRMVQAKRGSAALLAALERARAA